MVQKWNWWSDDFILEKDLNNHLKGFSFDEVKEDAIFYLPMCKYFYWDIGRFSNKLSCNSVTWVFWFAPNTPLHLWHLSVILSHIKLWVNTLVFSANDYEACFVRNTKSKDEITWNYNLSFELSSILWNLYNIKSNCEIRSLNKDITKIFNEINNLITKKDIIKIFWEDIWDVKSKAMNWQAAAYINQTMLNEYVIWISGVDELIPMIWVDFIAKKMKMENWGGFFIKQQIPSLKKWKKMSKSGMSDFNIKHKDNWDIVVDKLKLLLKKEEWANAMKEIFYLINEEEQKFSDQKFVDAFIGFTKKTNFFIFDNF